MLEHENIMFKKKKNLSAQHYIKYTFFFSRLDNLDRLQISEFGAWHQSIIGY